MKNKLILICLHLVFWIATSWLLLNSFSIQMRQIRIINGVETVNIVRCIGLSIQIISCAIISAVVFYITIWLVLRNNEFKKQIILLH